MQRIVLDDHTLHERASPLRGEGEPPRSPHDDKNRDSHHGSEHAQAPHPLIGEHEGATRHQRHQTRRPFRGDR